MEKKPDTMMKYEWEGLNEYFQANVAAHGNQK